MDLQPDPTVMQQFLDHLFGDATEGRVELAWTDAGDGKLRHARTFSLENLEELVEEAAKENTVEGQNVHFAGATPARIGKGNTNIPNFNIVKWADRPDALPFNDGLPEKPAYTDHQAPLTQHGDPNDSINL